MSNWKNVVEYIFCSQMILVYQVLVIHEASWCKFGWDFFLWIFSSVVEPNMGYVMFWVRIRIESDQSHKKRCSDTISQLSISGHLHSSPHHSFRYNYVLPTTWSYTKMNPPKNFSAILASWLWQDKSAQPAWVKLLTQAAWADSSCHNQEAKMAEKNFGRFILV